MLTSPNTVGMSSERLGLLEKVINKHIGEDKLSGVTTMIARKGEVIHFESYGMRDREISAQLSCGKIYSCFFRFKSLCG